MIHKNQSMVIALGIGIIFSLLTCIPNLIFAQQRPFATDVQKYNNGYNDGLRNAHQDSQGLRGHDCDSTVPAGHTISYQKGYSVGYEKGHCVSSGGSSSSSIIPGLTFGP